MKRVHLLRVTKHDKEYFLPYREYPWFKSAPVKAILNVRLLNRVHLHWPDLEVDLAVPSLRGCLQATAGVEVLPDRRALSDAWNHAKDGKQYLRKPAAEDLRK